MFSGCGGIQPINLPSNQLTTDMNVQKANTILKSCELLGLPAVHDEGMPPEAIYDGTFDHFRQVVASLSFPCTQDLDLHTQQYVFTSLGLDTMAGLAIYDDHLDMLGWVQNQFPSRKNESVVVTLDATALRPVQVSTMWWLGTLAWLAGVGFLLFNFQLRQPYSGSSPGLQAAPLVPNTTSVFGRTLPRGWAHDC